MFFSPHYVSFYHIPCFNWNFATAAEQKAFTGADACRIFNKHVKVG